MHFNYHHILQLGTFIAAFALRVWLFHFVTGFLTLFQAFALRFRLLRSQISLEGRESAMESVTSNSVWMNAFAATAAISFVPNVILFVIPTSLLTKRGSSGVHFQHILLCFAAGALLGGFYDWKMQSHQSLSDDDRLDLHALYGEYNSRERIAISNSTALYCLLHTVFHTLSFTQSLTLSY